MRPAPQSEPLRGSFCSQDLTPVEKPESKNIFGRMIQKISNTCSKPESGIIAGMAVTTLVGLSGAALSIAGVALAAPLMVIVGGGLALVGTVGLVVCAIRHYKQNKPESVPSNQSVLKPQNKTSSMRKEERSDSVKTIPIVTENDVSPSSNTGNEEPPISIFCNDLNSFELAIHHFKSTSATSLLKKEYAAESFQFLKKAYKRLENNWNINPASTLKREGGDEEKLSIHLECNKSPNELKKEQYLNAIIENLKKIKTHLSEKGNNEAELKAIEKCFLLLGEVSETKL